jgi:uncharacterized membrane protein YfcA
MFDLVSPENLFLLISLGLFAGLMAGLLGVGGGLVIVPALIFIFEKNAFAESYVTQMAVATSLATIIFTSISSIRSHHNNGLVEWTLVKNLTVGLVFGAVLGAFFASAISGKLLQLLFGIFAILVALQMWMNLASKLNTKQSNMPNKVGQAFSGLCIAFVSALFGIGGGSLSVPTLTWFGLDMKKAVAVSAACGLPIAVFSVVGFIATGLQVNELPEGSLGYVYLPALLCISVASVVTAHFGAQLAHKLPAQKLKQIFALFLFIIGLRLIVSSL